MEKREKTTNISLALSQATLLETYDRVIAIQNNNHLPKNDVTAVGTFICLNIAEKLLEFQPASDEEIADLII